MNILVSAPYFQPVIERFRPEFERRGLTMVIPEVNERLEEEDLLRYVGNIHGILCGDDRITPRVVDAAPHLRVVVKWGTGVDSIDATALGARGIPLRRTPNAFSEPVADSVIGYSLDHIRRLGAMTTAMRGGEWEKIPGRTLAECTVGIIGMGDVGYAVARRLFAFGATILATDIRPIDHARTTPFGVQMVSLQELLNRSDIVTLHADLNPSSYRILNGDTFAMMRPGTYVINTARGPHIHEAALIDALQSGHLGGAALDVFEHEPLPDDSPLRHFPNVHMAPHNANSSPRAWENVHLNSLRMLFESLGVP
jgi:D-3-phosphoglycerate dehydrogenase